MQTELQAEYEAKYGKGPFMAVDMIIEFEEEILLIYREDQKLAMPGGIVDPGEWTLKAAIREVEEETSIYIPEFCRDVEFFRFVDNPKRDPRGHIITSVYQADINDEYFRKDMAVANSEVKELKWWPKRALLNDCDPSDFYADHYYILRDYINNA